MVIVVFAKQTLRSFMAEPHRVSTAKSLVKTLRMGTFNEFFTSRKLEIVGISLLLVKTALNNRRFAKEIDVKSCEFGRLDYRVLVERSKLRPFFY